MKKLKKQTIITVVLTILLILSLNQGVLANNSKPLMEKEKYSEEFKQWLELPDEERKNVMQPRMYDVINTNITSKNPLSMAKSVKASVEPRFNLKDVIPTNLNIRNQQATNSCWAFGALSVLETTLALADYKQQGNNSKVYDYSERHMEYSLSRNFANGEVNEDGYNREVGAGGNWFLAETYLTKGIGAVNESEMPFENNEDLIDLSEIKNKNVSSQVYDTIYFPDYQKQDEQGKIEIMNKIKEHIQNYGAVYASLHGASSSTSLFNCYNNETGAKYCDSQLFHKPDHAISIVGWDDNYSIDNFAEGMKPKANGAWIIRNSWGERLEYNLQELKQEIFNQYEQECIDAGWTEPSLIPNSFIEANGYTIEGDIAYIKIGDNGFMYVSYEDCNISKNCTGITKADDKVNYENIYQYDEFFPEYQITYNASSILLANIFNKKSSGKEYLTQVSLYAPETYTCKVYVNANGTSLDKREMQLINLKAGESETIDVGYHTLEFAEPVEIKSNDFVVLIEIQGTRADKIKFSIEGNDGTIEILEPVTVETGKCFITTNSDSNNYEWVDLGKLKDMNSELINGDSTIKAFTVSSIEDDSLNNIQIETPPNKTKYFEGENFDKTGMVVKANYNNGTSILLDEESYNITDGTNLKAGQTSVTINYEDKSVTQPITVEKNTVTELIIKNPPLKTEYNEGENFNKEGMVVEATFKDGTKKEIDDYTIKDGNNLKNNQTKVTIEYGEKTVEQPITVIQNPLIAIKITKEPNKTKYIVGQNFDKTGMIVTGEYQNGKEYEIIDYIIENGTNLYKGQESVTIKYEDKTTTQKIIVEEKKVTSISIQKNPTKLKYIQNKEELDLKDGELKIIYNDGTSEIIPMTSEDITVTGFSNKNLGKIKITLTYQSESAELEVEIIEEAKAENSNLENAKTNVNNVKVYNYTDKNKKGYTLIDVEVNNILKNLTNDSLEYYYYISSNNNENQIDEWIKINEEQNNNDKLQFIVDSRKIKNYEELANEDVIYIYIKEVAIKAGNQSVAISKSMKLESNNIEIYIDDIKQNNNNPSNPNDTEDNTTAPGKLPQTGTNITICIVAIVILVIGTILFIRYKKLSKYLDK